MVKENFSKELFDRDQTSLVRQAIKGMLPKNRLGNAIYSNLHFMQVLIINMTQNLKK